MYVLLGDMLIPDIKDQIHGFLRGATFCVPEREPLLKIQTFFSLCTCVTETVRLYNELLCYFLNSNSILVYVVNTNFTCV